MPPRERLGKYEILEVLGRGAMGVVFKGFDPGIDRTVAIKTVRKELIEDDDRAGMALARFRNEARAAGRLAHPGIVAVYDYGESESVTYIAMEYVQGNSLREYFNRGARFREADVVSIMSQLLEALQHAHDAGVWHRDIKPANLIIMGNGRLKIADFGIARIEASQLTQTGVVMGSPGYMAPEQYAGGTVDWRADLFASAVVMHQLLTGVRLYTGTAEQVAYKICHQETPPPSLVDPGKGWERYDLLLQRALAKNPEHRFPSAGAFREAILLVYAAPVNASISEETIIAGTLSPAAVFEPSNPSARTGDASVSAPSRTPTPPPIAPLAIESREDASPAPTAHAAAGGTPFSPVGPIAGRWPAIAGVAIAVVVGAVLGGWWVDRSTRPPVPAVASTPPKPLAASPAPTARSQDAQTPRSAAADEGKKAKRGTTSPATDSDMRAASSKPEMKPAPLIRAESPEGVPDSASRPAAKTPPPKQAFEPLNSSGVTEAQGSAAPAKKREPANSVTTRARETPPRAPKQPTTVSSTERMPAKSSPPARSAVATARKRESMAGGSAAASPLGAPTPAPALAAAPEPATPPRLEVPTELASAAPVPETAAPVEPPAPAKPPPPPPSIWRDQGITMKVASKIQFNRRLWTSNIQVETSNGIVYLRGSVSSKELYDEAEKIAAAEYGVHGVKNELTIRP